MSQFTPRVQKVLSLAQTESQRLCHAYIVSEHLLLALVKLGGGLAIQILDEFDIDLQDFLPDSNPQGQSALPPTPMPNAQVVQTAAIPAAGAMNQGLTPIENALLSEEEKQIKLRSRGLA